MASHTPEEIESAQKVYDFIKNPPQSKSQLYEFLLALTGVKIPFTKVCPDHDSPFDFVWECYKIDLEKFRESASSNIICVGPRGGMKTLSQAHLILAELLTKPGSRTMSMAAIMPQSIRSYEYIAKFIKHPVIVESGLIHKLLRSRMELANDSQLELTCATYGGTNSWHGPKLRIDEVELIEDEGILEEAAMMPSSLGGWKVQTTYVSTRKWVDGNMESMLKKNRLNKSYKIMTWCVKEVSEPCPVERRGSKEVLYTRPDIENPGESISFTAYDGCIDCPLIDVCKGDLARSKGFIPIEDTINEFNTLDLSSFMAQKLCRVPKREDMFLPDFSEKLQIGDYPYNPEYPLDMAFDFTNGGDSPTAILFIQESPQGNVYFVGEKSFVRKPTETMVSETADYAQRELGITKVRMQVGDSAQMLQIRDFNTQDPNFFKIIPTKKILRKEGWPLCRRTNMDASGRRRLFVDRKCKLVIKELLNARRSKSDPDDVAENPKVHFLDGWRYWEVKMHSGQGTPNIRLLNPPTGDPRDPYRVIVPPSGPDNKPFMDRVWDQMRRETD